MRKHGEVRMINGKRVPTTEYRSWQAMRGRCTNPNHKDYRLYGGRGVTIDPRWDDYTEFLADMGRRPSSSHTIERVDTNGHYEPSNCRWATMKEQQRNRRNNKIFTHKGVTACLAELCEINGVKYSTAHQRLRRARLVQLSRRERRTAARRRDGHRFGRRHRLLEPFPIFLSAG